MERLYEKAFAYKKTKLWKKIAEKQIFAVRHSDGTIGYCSIMGKDGIHNAVALYPGDAGLDSLRNILEHNPEEAEVVWFERIILQDFISCSFENKEYMRDSEIAETRAYCSAHNIRLRGANAWPKFERFQPYHLPWTIHDDVDRLHLEEAIDVCLALSDTLLHTSLQNLGFSEGLEPGKKVPCIEWKETGEYIWSTLSLPEKLPIAYPKGDAYNEMLAYKVKKSKKRTLDWSCDIIASPQPMSEEDEAEEPYDAPYYALMLLILDKNGKIVDADLCPDAQDYSESFLDTMLNLMAETGKPKRITVINQRTYAMLENLTKYLGITLLLKKKCTELSQAEEDFFYHISEMDDIDEDELIDSIPDEDIELILFTIENARDFSRFETEQLISFALVATQYEAAISERQLNLLTMELDRRFRDM